MARELKAHCNKLQKYSINNRLVFPSRCKNSLYQHSTLKTSYKVGGEIKGNLPFTNAVSMDILHLRCCKTTAFMACRSNSQGQDTAPLPDDSHYDTNIRRNRRAATCSITEKIFVLISQRRGRCNDVMQLPHGTIFSP